MIPNPLIDEAQSWFSERLNYGILMQCAPSAWQIVHPLLIPGTQDWQTCFFVPGEKVDIACRAWSESFAAYQRLQSTAPVGSMMQIPSHWPDMTIRIGVLPEGVSVSNNAFTIATKDGLDRVLAAYDYATKRAGGVMRSLRLMRVNALPF